MPEVLMGVDGPVVLSGRRIGRSLPCTHCGQDLNGVSAVGRCPECGGDVVTTIRATIDPLAHRLPPIHRPQQVGWGLVVTAAALAIHAGFLLFFTAPYMIGLNGGVPSLPGMVWSITGIGLFTVTLVASVLIWPRSEGDLERSRGMRAAGALLGGGIVCATASLMPVSSWNVAMLMKIGASSPWGWVWIASDAAGMAIVLLGMRIVLVEVGRRSRAFRHGGLKRQRIPTLVATLVWMAVAACLALVGQQLDLPVLKITGGVLVTLTQCLAILGLLYLVVNAWWVRAAIGHPPPRLLDLLE